ncbi:MAG: ATP-binding cassette domain-containing protein [Oligoflexia bacterium]|nr:ATP-binding cassette domain-containing protein [Oligoflexia bacterium]
MRRERIRSLRAENLTHGFTSEAPVLREITMDLPFGKEVVLQGAPGSGKSLFLKILAGLITPNKGDVFYNEQPLKEMTFEEFAPLRTSTSVCFENGGLLMNKTLLENIQIGLLYNHQWRRERSDGLLKSLVTDFGIEKYLSMRPASVSSSVKKITGIIRSLVSTPQVIFLDDPSLGLGENEKKALKYWIEKYRQDGKEDELIVIASSDESLVRGLNCIRYVIEDGRIIPWSESTRSQVA